MNVETAYRRVVAAYPDDCQPNSARYLAAAGGFSGACFWRLETRRGPLCLRRWPREHPTRDRLEFIQAVLWHVVQEGFHALPLPLETRAHAGFVCEAGTLWELSPWLPGRADYHEAPSRTKLAAAVSALAEFHRAAASFPLPDHGPAASPGIAERLQRLHAWTPQRREQVSAALSHGDWPELARPARLLLELYPLAEGKVRRTLNEAARVEVPRQPCIRDIWHDHVLFVGEQVSGLIDFGAMRPESVAADVARLVGSLVGDDAPGWQHALSAYERIKPLSLAEALLVTAFDRANVLLSGMNWLEWIYLDRRTFDDRGAVEARLDENVARLARQ
ncbi:MAG TPA: phosphotransferase [Pirellulales bacterium]|nr:phosphotransferase [Pirellulales bacterium]